MNLSIYAAHLSVTPRNPHQRILENVPDLPLIYHCVSTSPILSLFHPTRMSI
ncbi:hypothetical protein Hanom_Chr06g00551201 [Helianthus anomalus]